MGNVASPIYCVRFNTTQDIQAKNIAAGLKVYVAPQTEYTNFIVLSDLMKEKGCDASWEYDNEAPDGCNEFSDDEEERLNRRQQNQRQRNKNRPSESSELPNKVTIKTEPNSNYKGRRNRNYNHKSQRNGGDNQPPTRFYKDNRGYANSDPSNFYHQQMPPAMHHLNHSWHTAQMHGMHPSMPSTSNSPHAMMQFPPPYTPHGSSNVYPNPFAMQANAMNYVSPFSLSAFPPLPPPLSSIPPHHQPPQLHPPYSRKNSSTPFQPRQQ